MTTRPELICLGSPWRTTAQTHVRFRHTQPQGPWAGAAPAGATSSSIEIEYLLHLQPWRSALCPGWRSRCGYCSVDLLIHCTRWIVEVMFVASAPPVVIVVEGNHGGAKPGLFVKRRSK